jgi:hypothetical protein
MWEHEMWTIVKLSHSTLSRGARILLMYIYTLIVLNTLSIVSVVLWCLKCCRTHPKPDPPVAMTVPGI